MGLTPDEEIMRKEIIDWTLMQEGVLARDGNSVSAEKLFLANSVIIWCIKKLRGEELKPPEVQGYIFFMKKYIRGTLDLFWEDGILYVSTVDE
jgi:hypothetical protein